MDGDHEYLPVLQDLAHANVELQRFCVPYILHTLREWQSDVDSEKLGQRSHHLHQLMRILDATDDQAVRETVAGECASRYRHDPNAPLAVVWLKGLFRFDSAQGARRLLEEFEGRAATQRLPSA